jgi:ketosteroid isomerase-like protein
LLLTVNAGSIRSFNCQSTFWKIPKENFMRLLIVMVVCLVASHAAQWPLNAQTAQVSESDKAAIIAADDSRIAAMRAPDREKLQAIFSDDLRYAHSTGVVDTKASFIEILVAGKTRYLGYDHVERQVTTPAPSIALVAGQARFRTESANGKMDSVLSYLAVWRLENGQWRFLAWQSCRLPVPENK